MSGPRIKRTGSRRQEDRVQDEERVHAVDELQTGGRTQSTGIVNKFCQRKNRVVFDEEGSYIENKASGRKVPMRLDNGVYVIDVHAKDLVDTRGSVFVGGDKRTLRPLSKVEVLVENEASKCRHEEQCSEVEDKNDDESDVQCCEE